MSSSQCNLYLQSLVRQTPDKGILSDIAVPALGTGGFLPFNFQLGLAARACHMSVAAGPDGPRSGIFEADLAFEHVQNRCIVVGLLS